MDMARKKGIRFHGSLKAIERLKGPADHQKFIQAVHEREVRLLQHLPPSANCLAGALDTITYRGTLLVVYACVNSVVVALGADLSVLRQISLPEEVVQKTGGRKPITAVTFRPADAAVVVGVQGFVVIYHGWYEGQVPERLWNSCEYEAIIPFGDDSGSRKISSLSFSLDSRRLAVVGDGVEVLECAQHEVRCVARFDEAGNASGKVVYESEMRVKAADCCEGVDYTLGSISPRGNLLVAASEGAEAGRAWYLGYPKHHPKSPDATDHWHEQGKVRHATSLSTADMKANVFAPPPPVHPFGSSCEVFFGKSGVSSLSWKLRGGGRAALLAVDIDGQMHVYAKVPRSTNAWMEEVARTPHMENVGRCAGTFMDWGGGGGAASDESDALGTAANREHINLAAPRPSRCYHYVSLACGLQIYPWRARGLDDRPKAAFSRLEPGVENEVPLLSDRAKKAASKMHVVAVRSVAPIPLTCSTEANNRVVKAYAISNNERRIRSPEPPEPPQVMVTFAVSALQGQTYLTRWDRVPTSMSPASCRARAGCGHKSSIHQIVATPLSQFSSTSSQETVSVVTLGHSGDALLWSLTTGSPFAPLQVAGRLKGPHTAATFPSAKLSQAICAKVAVDDPVSVLFAVDGCTNSLNIYTLVEKSRASRKKSFMPCPFTKLLTQADGPESQVTRLLVAPQVDEVQFEVVLGLNEDGTDLCAWRVDPYEDAMVKKTPVRLEGDFSVPMSSATISTANSGECQLLCGGKDGRVRIYTVSMPVENGEYVLLIEDLTAIRCGDSTSDLSPIVEITATPVASRIAALQADGTLTVFALSNIAGSSAGFRREFCCKGLGVREKSGTGCLAFGMDVSLVLQLAVGPGEKGKGIHLFSRDQGLDWKESFRIGEQDLVHEAAQPTAFVAPGVLISGESSSLLVYSTTSGSPFSHKNSMTLINPYNMLHSMLWTGRSASEVVVTLGAIAGQLTEKKAEALIASKESFKPRPPPMDIFCSSGPVEPASEDLLELIGNLTSFANALRGGLVLYKLKPEQQKLMLALVESCAHLASVIPSLDKLGAGFALTAMTFLKNPLRQEKDELMHTTMAAALHSTSADALIDLLIQTPFENDMKQTVTWDYCRSLGVGWWVRTGTHVKKLAERIARNLFMKTRDPDSCAMWYVFLGKAKALAVLYRQKSEKRMFEFLQRDFAKDENRKAAAKNAYVLVSKHRLELAAAFFFLAGEHASATQIIRARMGDTQLALLLARLINDGALVDDVLQAIAKQAAATGRHHEEAMALWLLGQRHEALSAATMSAKVPDAPTTLEKTIQQNGSIYDGRQELQATLCALNHVLAIASSPAMMNDSLTAECVARCRSRATAALTAEGSPVQGLFSMIELLKGDSTVLRDDVTWIRQLTAHVTRRTLAWRAVVYAGVAESEDRAQYLSEAMASDAQSIAQSPIGFVVAKQAALSAAQDLSLSEDVDAAIALAVAAYRMSKDSLGIPARVEANAEKDEDSKSSYDLRRSLSISPLRKRSRQNYMFEEVLRKVVLYSLYQTSAMFSHTHTLVEGTGKAGGVRVLNQKDVNRLAYRLDTAISILKNTTGPARKAFQLFEGDLVRSGHLISVFGGFLAGDWVQVRNALNSTAGELNQMVVGTSAVSESATNVDDIGVQNFAEELRQVADNPLLQPQLNNKKEEAGRTRRMRISQHFSRGSLREILHERQNDAARIMEVSSAEQSKLRLSAPKVDPEKIESNKSSTRLIREQSLLTSILSACGFAAMTSCVANMASSWTKKRLSQGRRDVSILVAAEALDALAMDAVYGWYPLLEFGRDSTRKDISDGEVSYFAALWKSMASIPDFAPFLREAATVAAAIDASNTARLQQVNRRRARDATDFLDNPFPVRFSAGATGPWSGRGKFSVLFREEGALIRSLCVASSDPPLMAMSTPRGIQLVIPSSYAPSKPTQDDIHLSPTFRSPKPANRSNSWSFFESEYDNMVLYADESSRKKHSPDAVTLSETEATALAAHPRRRRFASGGADGLVRLWNFGEKISRAGLRDSNHGRVVSLQFSAYGDGLLCTYANGYVAIWHDPDVYHSHASGIHEGDAIKINAFGNRRASDAIFLDERNLVAVVGDQSGVQGGASSSVGHSLRVFDIREASSSMRATWTARVHTSGEGMGMAMNFARSLALLEDRMRIVTGGCDGSLSVVDSRTRACVAELPAHDDEVICLRLESPRGRALASGCRNGDIKIWDARTLRVLDLIPKAHSPTRQWLTGTGFGGLVGTHGVRDLYLTDRSLTTCGGDGLVKVWGPGWGDFDHQVL